jgi:hypothetical protein
LIWTQDRVSSATKVEPEVVLRVRFMSLGERDLLNLSLGFGRLSSAGLKRQ